MKKAKKHLSQGMTIVEMIVAFAIFAVMAMMFISIIIPANNMHYETQTWKQEINAQAAVIEAKGVGSHEAESDRTFTFSAGGKTVSTTFKAAPAVADAASEMTHLRYFDSTYVKPDTIYVGLNFEATDPGTWLHAEKDKNKVEAIYTTASSELISMGIDTGTHTYSPLAAVSGWKNTKTEFTGQLAAKLLLKAPGSSLTIRVYVDGTSMASGTFSADEIYGALDIAGAVTFVYDGSTITLK